MSSGKVKAYKDYKWIVQDPELVGGHLAIRGTRLPVSLILECMASGFDLDEISKQYPTFPREALSEVFKVAAVVTDSFATFLTRPNAYLKMDFGHQYLVSH